MNPLPRNGNQVRVFIGSGEASVLERKTLIHTLRKHSARQLDICVFNGTHDSLEREACAPARLNMPLDLKYRNSTEFSLYRFMIPELCDFHGRAIWLDSDMLCLADIGRLFDLDMHGSSVCCAREYGASAWATSTMLIDCAAVKFDLPLIFRLVDERRFSYDNVMRLEPPFLEHFGLDIGELEPAWNLFDRRDPGECIVHYTNLMTQPWRVPGHPLESLWFEHFGAAVADGSITGRDIAKAVHLGYARADIRGVLSNPPRPARFPRLRRSVLRASRILDRIAQHL